MSYTHVILLLIYGLHTISSFSTIQQSMHDCQLPHPIFQHMLVIYIISEWWQHVNHQQPELPKLYCLALSWWELGGINNEEKKLPTISPPPYSYSKQNKTFYLFISNEKAPCHRSSPVCGFDIPPSNYTQGTLKNPTAHVT